MNSSHTSNWAGIGFLVGSGLTVVHFLLSLELTSTTRLSFAHLKQRQIGNILVKYWNKDSSSLTHSLSLKNVRHSRVSCFGGAILLVFVGLAELAVPPALATHKHHLQVRRPKPHLCVWKLLTKCGENWSHVIKTQDKKMNLLYFYFNPHKVKSSFVFNYTQLEVHTKQFY